MKEKTATTRKANTPSKLIDGRIKELMTGAARCLAHVRTLIKQADPDVVETWKWRGVPVWEHDGILCTEVRPTMAVVKLTFRQGRCARGSIEAVQLQPRRQRPSRHRHP